MLLVYLLGVFVLSTLHRPVCRRFVDSGRTVLSRLLVVPCSLGLVACLAVDQEPMVVLARSILVVGLVALVEIDLLVRRLPREISYPAAVISFALLTLARPERWWSMILGAAIPTALMMATSWASRRQLGSGDVRMAPLLGVHLGFVSPTAVFYGFTTSFVIAGTSVFALLLFGRASRSSTIPFGPFLAAGTVIVLAADAWSIV